MGTTDRTTGRFYDRYDLLFAVTVATVGLLLLVDLNRASGFSEFLAITVTVLTGGTLLLAIAAAGIERRGLRFSWIAVGVTVVASIVAAFFPREANAYGGLLWLLLVVAAPFVTLKRLVHHERVSGETVLGAVSVYLLMAVAGTYLFLFIDAFGGDPGRFFGQPEPTTVFMYFSLVTITTLGYGDFSPVEVFGRAATAWVAIIGQIYLVVVVARMVTLFGGFNHRASESNPGNGD